MMVALLSAVFALFGILLAIYFVAPAIAFNVAVRLARRNGGLRLHYVEIDNHRIPYLEGGSGEPLLLLHGFAANKDHWTMIAPYLTPRFRVIAVDLPGFGDASRLPHASYDVDAQVSRILQFADALGLAEFHLGGNSMGGYLAAIVAKRASSRIKSLWLLAPAGALSAKHSAVMTALERGENPLIATTMAEFDRLSNFCFTKAPPMPAQFKRPLLARSQADAPFNAKIFAEMFSDLVGLEALIEGLETRSLVVWGDDDRILDCSGLEIIARLLPHSTTILMPRMGHAPMLERPADTAADYLRFRDAAS